MKALRIAGWLEHYETAESRKLITLSWVATPNGHDSLGYCEIQDHPEGMAHYGAWNLILQVASRCPTRGLLVNGKGRAYDAHGLALVTRSNERLLSEAIPRLLAVGWLEEVEVGASAGVPGENPGAPAGPPGNLVLQDRTGQDRTGEGQAPAPPVPEAVKRRKALARVLRKNGLPASEASVSEWGDLMTGLGGCASPEAVYEGIAWIVARAHRDGNSVSYAREAASLATQWAKRQGAPA